MAVISLHWADYVIFITFFGISLVIGVYYACSGGRQQSVREFLMANHQLRVIPTVLSLVMTYLSALTILGGIAEVYLHGVSFYCWFLFGHWVAVIIVERIFIPWLYPLKLTSVFEYYERRFNSRTVRVMGSLIGILNGVLYIGIAIYAPSLALEAVTGMPVVISIPILSLVATVYTAMGGMKAVIWTDVFQCIITIAGLLSVLIRAIILVGGIEKVMDLCNYTGRLQPASKSLDPTIQNTVWSLFFGFSSSWTYMLGTSQSSVQRYSATGSLRTSRLVMLIALPTQTFITCLAVLTGLSIFAYFFDQRCDPTESGQIKSANQLFPFFVKVGFEKLYGFQGLILATLYSGALSSASSSLSGCCANAWEDFIKAHLKSISERGAAVINKVLVLTIGLLGMGISYLCISLPGSLIEIMTAFFGVCGGPSLGLFLLGGVTSANYVGAIAGGTVSLIFNMWLTVGVTTIDRPNRKLLPAPVDSCFSLNSTNSTLGPDLTYNYTKKDYIFVPTNNLTGIDRMYSICYLWYTPIGVIICVGLGLAVSAIATLVKPELKGIKVDPDLFIPWKAITSFDSIPGREHLLEHESCNQKPSNVMNECIDVKDLGASKVNNGDDHLPSGGSGKLESTHM